MFSADPSARLEHFESYRGRANVFVAPRPNGENRNWADPKVDPPNRAPIQSYVSARTEMPLAKHCVAGLSCGNSTQKSGKLSKVSSFGGFFDLGEDDH